MAETTVNLDQFETKAVFELESRAASTYLRQLMIRGNALLSSVYIKSASAGATLKVNYFDTTSGDTNTGERYDLLSHSLLTDANVGDTVRLLIPRIHNKPQVEAIVTGTVEFGLYVTVVADFPVDLQGALDGQTADLLADDGLPISVYDPSDGKFYLLRGPGGYIATDPEGPGDGKVLQATSAISVGPEVTILTGTVPAGKTWRVRYSELVCRGHGRWRLLLDGVRIGGGLTSAAREHDRVSLPSGLKATAGQILEVKYTYGHGPANIDIDAFIGVTEV